MKALFALAAAALCAAFAAGATPTGNAASAPRFEPPPGLAKSADLDSRLGQVFRAQQSAGRGAVAARGLGLDVAGGRVRVVVEAHGGQDTAARGAVQAGGGEVEATYGNLVQALVPAASLEGLSHSPAVTYVRAPHQPVAQAVTGEELERSGADDFQAAQWTGAGVKVAIIDLGFAGLADRQAQGDLPASVTTQDFCGGGFSTVTEHGTGVAEIVHEVAPDAQLYLICVNSDVTLGQAEEYAKANGITIVNTSFGIFNDSRGDGSGGPGTVDSIVADARANGILWVAAAGNLQQAHWSGTFNGGGIFVDLHDFGPGDETNDVVIAGGQTACFFLRWDAWPATHQDYDLYLLNGPDTSTAAAVAASTTDQAGAPDPGLPPTEEFCYTNPGPTATFYLIIYQFSGTAAPQFDLYMLDTASYPQYRVPTGSIAEPASSPNVMAVAALCWFDASPRNYSSLGPTIDGRVKPDITGLDGVSGGTYGTSAGCSGGFAGTSAASPHVAGLAALGKQQNPTLTPAQLQTWLQARALDIGAPGKDIQFGWGRAFVSTFTDTPAWTGLQPEVELLFRKGTTGGCSPLDPATGTRLYCPEQTVTRDQMAVFIIRSLGLAPLTPATPTFDDVPSSYWAFGEIERLAEQGITGGCQSAPALFCPTTPVRRDQMAAFLVRARGLTELLPAVATFVDVPTDFWAFGYVERLVEQGITGGCSSNPPRYCPADPVTRRQMAAFLIRTFGGPAPA